MPSDRSPVRARDGGGATPRESIVVELDREEALWLKSAARRGAEDTQVPGATDALYKLARKIGRAITEAEGDRG